MMKKILLLISALSIALQVNAVSIKYGVAREQNQRPYQEDRDVQRSIIRKTTNRKLGDFFAVYDGHGGDKVSSFLKNNLHTYFTFYLLKNKTEKNAFKEAFRFAEKKALKHFNDGSTAVAAYVTKNNILHCASTGDSRLVVYKGGATQDHKPDRADEKDRIEAAGGVVYVLNDVARVNGLAVSRSIGDRNLKKGAEGQIIATPEYIRYPLTPKNKFAIMASDGLWDVVSNEEALDFVHVAFKKKEDPTAVAEKLKNIAMERGSGDNITVIVAQFDWSKK
jgi:serine/threonine protein phosphatase PrpC